MIIRLYKIFFSLIIISIQISFVYAQDSIPNSNPQKKPATEFLINLDLSALRARLCLVQQKLHHTDSTFRSRHPKWDPDTILAKIEKWRVTDSIPQDVQDFYELNIDDLDKLDAFDQNSELEKDLNNVSEVGVQKSISTLDNPGIVTIITSEEITQAGARDLIDVLRLVPGMHFGLDQNGYVSLGIRGNWANEGKILLMIDGLEMNELYAANISFGNHYPVDLIERIEVIKGPGSAVYGGFAEFGVINIITKSTESHNGIYWGVHRAANFKAVSKKTFSLYFGKKWDKKSFSISTYGGKGYRSDRDHFAFHDNATSMDDFGDYCSLKEDSNIDPGFINLTFTNGNFSVRSIFDLYKVTNVSTINDDCKHLYSQSIRTNYTELKYVYKPLPKLVITPRMTGIFQYTKYKNGDVSSRRNYMHRPRLNLNVSYDITHRINLLVGADAYFDKITNELKYDFLSYTDNEFDYKNTAAFSQLLLRFPWINVTMGARYETNTEYGSTLVPRLTFTKRFENWHFKFLLGKGYRAPTVGNLLQGFDGSYSINSDSTTISLQGNLIPETTNFIEAEIGYRINKDALLTCNIFDINTSDPIVYYTFNDETISNFMMKNYHSPTGIDVYSNFDESGTQGFELGLKLKNEDVAVSCNYSFYSVRNKVKIEPYAVNSFNLISANRVLQNRRQLIGFPNHKINVAANYNILNDLTANFSLTVYGKRYSYNVNEETPENPGVLQRMNPSIIGNVYFNFNNYFIDGLNFGFGVYNMFNSGYEFIQPYFGLNPPLPGQSRQFVINLSYYLDYNTIHKIADSFKI